jgi:transcriptional regulator with XRE-family HTH domain
VAIRGDRLKEVREQRKLSQERLAQLCNMSANQIRRYEKSNGNPTSDHLIAMVKALRVSADWLLGLTSQRTQRKTKKDLTEDQLDLLAAWESRDFQRMNALFWKRDAENKRP